jgi:hypothetical protein
MDIVALCSAIFAGMSLISACFVFKIHTHIRLCFGLIDVELDEETDAKTQRNVEEEEKTH